MRLYRLLVPVFIAAVLWGSLGFATAFAQSEEPNPRPGYPLPTYEENWAFLRDPSRRTDRWDQVKFVPLDGDASAFLSLGGEARETYERFGNQNFGLTTPSPDGYWLQRYLLHADLHLGPRVRVWGELSSSLITGRIGGPRPVIDEDELDLHQGFIDLSAIDRADTHTVLRFGRQEMAFGSGRMYSLREGVNVPLSFDGGRLMTRTGSWRIDAWAARPIVNTPGAFDDGSHRDFGVWGAYASRPAGGPVGIDVYYLGWDKKGARFDKGVGNELRHTLGVRAWRPGTWAYDVEGIYQFGRFGAGDIRAWRVAAQGARELSATTWHPHLVIDLDIASGDDGRSDPTLRTFNAFFQSGTYSGRAQLLGPNNSIRFEPSLTFTPARTVLLSSGWGFYWRENIHDGLYGIPGQLIVPSNDVDGRYEGSRPIAQLDWSITPHLSAHLNYIFVFNARFEERSVGGTSTMSYVSPWITYRF